MLKLPRKISFSVEAVLDIAYHSSGRLASSRDITRRQGIPRRYLEQVLQQLVRGGILIGKRGPKGGYRLSRERRRIMVGDIIRCIWQTETPDSKSDFKLDSELGVKVLDPLWDHIQVLAIRQLDNISIEDLCNKAKKAGVKGEGNYKHDFII